MWESVAAVGGGASLAPRSDEASVERLLLTTMQLRQQLDVLYGELVQQERRLNVGPDRHAAGAHTAALPAADLYVTFLGKFALYREGQALPLGSNKAVGELCRYLIAHAGQRVPRDVLLDLLWPDEETETAIHRLHVSVSALRHLIKAPKTAESWIQFEDECYSVTAGSIITDCDLFEAHYKRGRRFLADRHWPMAAAAFSDALDLYQGDYLADHLYTEWTYARRAHFVEHRLAILTFLCGYAATENRLDAVIDYAEQIIAIDNLRESSYRYLMRAHYAMGQRACAMRHYQRCVETLQHELGARPSQQTSRLYEAICHDTELPPETSILLSPGA